MEMGEKEKSRDRSHLMCLSRTLDGFSVEKRRRCER